MFVTKELLSGALFIAIGGTFAVTASGYPLGSAIDMGPGFFPLAVSFLVITMGLILFVRGLLTPALCERVADFQGIRPMAIILAAVVAFALLVERAGLIVSLVVLIVIGRLAGGWPRPLELLSLLTVLIAVAVGIFVFGLGIPFKLWF